MKTFAKKIIKKYLTKKIVVPVETPIYNGEVLKNKKALIVGGGGGIGCAIAEAFLNQGCSVAITGTNEKKLEKIKKSLGSVNVHVLDVKDIGKMEQNLSNIIEENGKFDIVVYAAGTHSSERFGNITYDTWESVMNVNLRGMYFLCQYMGNYMIENDIKGHILTIGSASCNKPGWTPYEISKAAVKSLTLGIADKLIKYGIVVNSIAPGPVATRMLKASKDNLTWEGNPSGRMSIPEEIANLAVFMVSDFGNMIVGDTYFISGGSGTICIDR